MTGLNERATIDGRRNRRRTAGTHASRGEFTLSGRRREGTRDAHSAARASLHPETWLRDVNSYVVMLIMLRGSCEPSDRDPARFGSIRSLPGPDLGANAAVGVELVQRHGPTGAVRTSRGGGAANIQRSNGRATRGRRDERACERINVAEHRVDPVDKDPIGALHPSQPEPGLLAPDAEINLTNCDREPIHLSGAVQPHGALLAVNIADFVITQVSANTAGMLGLQPDGLLGADLSVVLGESAVAALRAALHQPRGSRSIEHVVSGVVGSPFLLTWHRSGVQLVIEIEPSRVLPAYGISACSSRLACVPGHP